ncbi:stomatin-like isoform X2 [Lethenteron reissneri]|uniref:stomatin-like isoform X2 n=1 Tax=Lethenteron reissneri TaxID=7753 RepID=UPI002AB66F11|nr:stomatin-like isoform X2 [Lethenteron reissneri]
MNITGDSDGKRLKKTGCCEKLLGILSMVVIILTFPLSVWFCLKVVREYERAVVFRLGKLLPGGAIGPGLFLVMPCIDTFVKVDMRTVTFDVPPQEILTRDSVTVAVDAVVYYRVHDATAAVTNVVYADGATRLLAQTALRNVLGTRSLSDIVSERETSLDEATEPWGIKVQRVEIKDVRLPPQMQRAMAAEAEAIREARAKVVSAEGEMNASRSLKEAAIVLGESSGALQLRYLQTLNNIAAERNSTIIFPIPIDILSALRSNSNSSSNML